LEQLGLTREQILACVASRDDWAGNFSVVDDGTVRMRPLK
jgi:hypothetical protein